MNCSRIEFPKALQKYIEHFEGFTLWKLSDVIMKVYDSLVFRTLS